MSDPNISLKESDDAGPWWYNRYCSACLAEVGHQGVMTQICLKCGSKFAESILHVPGRASRRYRKDGEWVIQHRYPNGSFGYSPAPIRPPTVERIGVDAPFYPPWPIAIGFLCAIGIAVVAIWGAA